MNAPPPLANPHFPEQGVISAKRRKDGELGEVLRDVDYTLRPPSPDDDEAATLAGTPALMLGVSATMLSPSD
jgi:hypothetical protein